MSGALSRRFWSLPVLAVCCAAAVLIAAGLIASGSAPAQDGDRFAYSIAITDEINQRAAHDLERAMADAEKKGASVVIIRLDAPGGGGDEGRTMVRQIAAASMPVIVYVHPRGGRAASDAMFLMLAGDVAAMTPGTTTGSAVPMFPRSASGRGAARDQLQRDLRRKRLEDAVASARSLAEEHGRNAALAERMIRSAVKVSASRALRENLVDVVAPSERSLLSKIDGFRVKGSKAQTLQTAGLEVRRISPSSIETKATKDLDESSLVRSLAYVFVPIAMVPLLLLAFSRWRPRWRRARHRRRVRRRRRDRDGPGGSLTGGLPGK